MGGYFRYVIVGISAICVAYLCKDLLLEWIGAVSPVMQERVLATIEAGDTSGRDVIYDAFLKLWGKNPVFGSQFTYYSGGSVYYFHNIILDSIICGGIIGLSIMLYFYYRVAHYFYICVKHQSQYIWMAFFFVIFFIAHLSSGAFFNDASLSIALVVIAITEREIKPHHHRNLNN